jgi:hypothetical protein
MGLRHFGQGGGGAFLGMDAQTGPDAGITELKITEGCRWRAVMQIIDH